MKTLISMEDYVLEQNEFELYKHSDDDIRTYAKLLKSKPTLGQFVPTDDEGNVLDEKKPYQDNYYKYQPALDKVIFDGWVLYEVTKHSTIIINGENYMHFYFDNDVYINHANISTISDLTKYNLKLK